MFFYILRLKICGIKNIEAPVEFNFYKKTISNDFDPEKYRIKAIYGENGSGKTAVITSVKLLQNLLMDKSYLADSDTQRSLVEMVNKKTKKGFVECEFYVNFDDEKLIMCYRADFAVKNDERFYLTAEKLESKNGRYSKNAFSPVFVTNEGSLIKYADKSAYAYFKEKTMNLLDKQTFSSSIIDLGDIIKEYRKADAFVQQMLLSIFALSLYVSLDEADNHINYAIRERIREMDEETLKSHGIDLIHQISSKVLSANCNEHMILKKFYNRYEKKIDRLCDFIKIFKPELKGIEIEKKDYDKCYRCNLKMVYEDYTLDKEFESRGIKKLMDLFNFLDAASTGSIVFIDELDSNINDVYLDKLIEYFVYYGKGQLCFTSHNLSPMSVLKGNKNSINFISSINTVHVWTNSGNLSPENAYKNGFIEDSPFNVDASDFLGILGDSNE
ncbi:AAA family ATPase [Butyrivibrio sp. NC3005]|uniref:AAA family ATPase n=1 Tax=Butyrivibrio sp. NC3005 TaxID=1280685 RepID=UPI000421F8F1|nr:AAA family ATPase [Butyrivibrio sp. NC3005]